MIHQQLDNGEVGEEGRIRAGGGPEDAVEAGGVCDDGEEEGGGEIRAGGAEGK